MLHSFESELNTQIVESDKVLTMLIFCCFNNFSDRTIPNLDTLVPFDSTKAYDILDVIYPVSVLCVGKWIIFTMYLSCSKNVYQGRSPVF